jgi:hypothetical protein
LGIVLSFISQTENISVVLMKTLEQKLVGGKNCNQSVKKMHREKATVPENFRNCKKIYNFLNCSFNKCDNFC